MTSPAVEALLELLSADPASVLPGSTPAETQALASALGAPLPDAMEALYRRCGGVADTIWRVEPHAPMRLMTPAEVVDTKSTLRDCVDTYHPSPEAEYFFTDDDSNWIGVFVRGPLLGKACILDHDDPSVAPRFRCVESLAASLVDAARSGSDFTEMRTDYPRGPEPADEALEREDLALARAFLERCRAAESQGNDAYEAAETALFLLPPTETELLEEGLRAEQPSWLRGISIRVARSWRKPELIAALATAVRGANFTRWGAILDALVACGGREEARRVWEEGESSWKKARKRPTRQSREHD